MRKKSENDLASLVALLLLGAAGATEGSSSTSCSTCTSDAGGSNPIQINSVLNYGYSGMTGSQIFNATSNLNTIFGTAPSTYDFGNITLSWSYWNTCPTLYYSSGGAKCECNPANWEGASSTSSLYFGSPGNYTTVVDGGNYNPSSYPSTITQSGSNTPYALNYINITQPSTQIKQSASGTSYDPGDVLYTLFGGYIGGSSSGIVTTPVNVTNPVINAFWLQTGTGTYHPSLVNGCVSTDNGGKTTETFATNSAGAFIPAFSNPNIPAAGYGITFGTSNVSSSNISTNTTPTASNPQVLFSDDGSGSLSYNQAFAPLPVNGQAASPSGTSAGQSGSASLTINTNSFNTTETFTLGATATQTMTQTTQQGVTNTDTATAGVNASVTLGNTTGFTVTDGVETGTDSLSESFTAGFNASYTNTNTVNYSTTQTNTTTNSSTITMQLVFSQPQPSSTTATYTNSGSASPTSGQPASTGTYDVGACYLATITQNAGPAYLDSTFNIGLTSSNYGTVPVTINGGALKQTSAPITVLANSANLFNWWESVYNLGAGTSSSLQVNGNTVTVEGQGQLQSNVNSDLYLSILENTCPPASNAAPRLSASVSPLSSDSPPYAQFKWISAAETINPDNIGFPMGIGYTPRHHHGFAVDLVGTTEGVYYVGSQERDLLKFGSGSDKVVAGNGDDTVYAGKGDDLVSAGSGRNTLYGEEGNDLLMSGIDADSVVGGDGNDKLVGGGGLDHFVPGNGADQLYLDSDSTVQIEGISLKDSVIHGKFQLDSRGSSVKVMRNFSRFFILEPSKAIGFAHLKDTRNNKVVGMVKSQGNLYTARSQVWSDVALINIQGLPKRLFMGVKVNSDGMAKLATKTRDWHFKEGYRLGTSVYSFSDWNELRGNQVALRSWIQKIGKQFGRRNLSSNELSGLVVSAQNTASAAAFVTTNFSPRK